MTKNEPYEVVLDEAKASEAVQKVWAKAARSSKLRKPPKVPPRQDDTSYKRPKMSTQRFVEEVY